MLKALFSIPDFFGNFRLNRILVELLEKYPEYFRNDFIIDNIYGSFPCIWNGGRLVSGECSEERIISTIDFFNSHNISIRHTFTNQLLNETHCANEFGNYILKTTSAYQDQFRLHNGTTLYSPTLFNYIQQNYPNLELIYSTTRELQDINIINEFSRDHIIVLPYFLNKNYRLLEQLKYPENIELLCVDEGCLDNCPYRAEHQYISSLMQLDLPIPTNSAFAKTTKCINPQRINSYYEQTITQNYVITQKEISFFMNNFNINKFKISGRSHSIDSRINVIENYINYFVRDEYRDLVRNKLLLATFK